jgi:hypothetical protein
MVVSTLRAVRWTFSTSGLTLIYLASAVGVLTAISFAGWALANDSYRVILISLLVALPYLTALMAVQLVRTNRDAALVLLFATSLASGGAALMSSVFGLALWPATLALLLGTLLIALSEMSFEHRQAGT